jgi:hypothetical protein
LAELRKRNELCMLLNYGKVREDSCLTFEKLIKLKKVN